MRKLLATGAILLAAQAVLSGTGSSQDPLSSARELYASARYDEALATLDGLREAAITTTLDRRAIEQYRSLCLLALGRSVEADAAIAAVVRTDPFYQPGDADASPRVRAAFQEVRRRLLPEIASDRYTAAKATWDRKDYPEAADLFRQVLTLIDDPDMRGHMRDLRTIAAGFLELAEAAARPAETSAPLPVEAPRPAAPPVSIRVYNADDPGVVPPVVLRQDLPTVPPQVMKQARDRGILEVVVNEQGRVQEATIRVSVHPVYDSLMLAAAREWRFQPAVAGGAPVKFRKRIQISVAKR
jgi:protein TonB